MRGTPPRPRPGTSDPPRARRPRPARGSPDGHRQDRRVRAADPRAPPGATRTPASRPRDTRSVRSILTPTRELAMQVERQRPRLRPLRAAPVGRRLRRRAGRSAGQGAAGGLEILVATPGRLLDHRRPALREPRPGRDPRPGRGGPDAGHGLPARHPQDRRSAADAAPEPAVLGDLPRGDPRARRRCCTTPRPSRSRRATRPSTSCASWSTPWTATASGRCWRTSSAARLAPGARVHPHEDRGVAPRRVSSSATASRPWPSTATVPRPSARGRSRRSATARSGSSSRPTSPRAASTSRICRTS